MKKTTSTSFFSRILSCKKGFSLVETSIVLAIVGCILAAGIYRGTRIMEKARTQKIQKEIVHCCLYINQWKSDPFLDSLWEGLSTDGLHPKNTKIWKKMVSEGVVSQSQIGHNKVPSLGRNLFMSIICVDGGLFLCIGGINDRKTDAPALSIDNAKHLMTTLRDAGLFSKIQNRRGNLCSLIIDTGSVV